MTLYDFDQIIDRRGKLSLKWGKYPEDVLPLWVADMDFVSPQPVIDALKQRIEHGVFGYPEGLYLLPDEIPAFRQTIVDRMERLYHWKIEPADIVPLPGVVTGFNLACHALAGPGAGVLIHTPVYHPILHAAHTTASLSQEYELVCGADSLYEIDFDAFEASFTPQTRMFLLCNPHNPVGRVFRPDELLKMADICLKRKIWICSDEIHCDLVFSGYQHTPIASLDAEIAQRTITLMAPSKTYNLAGLQCSFAIIPNPELRQQFLQARKGLVPWVNLMGLVAAQAAYQDGDEWLEQVLQYLQGNRDDLYEFVNSQLPGVRMGLPEGTYLAWLDFRSTSVGENPYKFLLEKARVAFNDGATFGRGGAGFVRLNFGCPRSILREALNRVREALE